MVRFITVSLFWVLFCTVLSAQTFSISEINASEFPKIKASFIALDGSGRSYQDLTKDNFTVLENSQNMGPTLGVECISREDDPEVSVVLVLDKSGSMDTDPDGIRRWNWVVKGATSFINTLKFVGNTAVAITTFARFADVTCPFTNDKQELLDSLATVKVAGTTRYDDPFIDQSAGVVPLLRERSSELRRIVVFLTDGLPDKEPETGNIIDSLQQTNIQVYSITLQMPMNDDLRRISKETGGDAFEVYTEEELDDIYKYIALDVQTKTLCFLSWISEYGCDERSRTRDVSIRFKKDIADQTIEREYTAPVSSIADFEKSTNILSFGNPEIGIDVFNSAIFMPIVTDFYVENVKTEPSGYFTVSDIRINGNSVSPPFRLDSGTNVEVEVKFTQAGAKLYRQAALVVEGTPCPPQVTLVGGASKILILEPEDGTVFSVCDEVDIIWAGIEPNVPVNLTYTTDGGTTWRPIASGATGLQYRWEPPVAGETYQIRGVVASQSEYRWAKSFGGPEEDAGSSIVVQDNNLFAYVTGHFDGLANFGVENKESVRLKDIFVMKLNTDGNPIWVEEAGGLGVDSASGICIDPANNVYITGTVYKSAKFGSLTPTIEQEDLPYAFIARYPEGGGNPRVTTLGAKGVYTGFRCWAQRIKYVHDETDPRIFIQGQYTSNIQITLPGGKQIGLPRRDNPTTFTAEYDIDLNIKDIYLGGPNENYSSNVAIDSDGNTYRTGKFTGTQNYGIHEITSDGKNDIFVTKYGSTPGSEGFSGEFTIEAPEITLNLETADLGLCILGSSCSTIFPALLENTGDIDLEIESVEITGLNPDDFSIATNLVGEILAPGEIVNIELVITPDEIGPRNAKLTIIPVCGEIASIALYGEGVCEGEAQPLVNIGQVNVNITEEFDVVCIFRNPNDAILEVRPELVPDISDPGEFWFVGGAPGTINLQPDSCVSFRIGFKPNLAGIRTVKVLYNLDEQCEYVESIIQGEGVDSDIIVHSINWFDRRVLTVNDSTFEIFNNSGLASTIESITIDDPKGRFEFPVPSLPFDIGANETYPITVSFKPTSDEQEYEAVVTIKVRGSDTEIKKTLIGRGVRPMLEMEWECPPSIIVGKQSQGILTVSNASIYVDTWIEKMEFRNNTGEFVWINGQPMSVTIEKGESMNFNIGLNPTQGGQFGDLVYAYADTAIGNGVDALFEPIKRADHDVICSAGGGSTDEVDFGGQLLCETRELQFRIVNDNDFLEMILYKDSVLVTGNEEKAFDIIMDDDITIEGGNFAEISIAFTPREEKEYNVIATFINSQGTDVVGQFLGTGEAVYLDSDKKEYKVEPGNDNNFVLKANIDELKNPVEEMIISFEFNQGMTYIHEDKLVNEIGANWTWETPALVADGLYEIRGTGSLNTPFNGELFTLPFTIYLSDTQESGIMAKVLRGDCDVPTFGNITIKLDSVCFVNGRLVSINAQEFGGPTVIPNPPKDEVKITYSVGLNIQTSIEIINSFGEVVAVVENKRMKPGYYDASLPVSELSSGVYFIRMQSGPYSHTEKMIISK